MNILRELLLCFTFNHGAFIPLYNKMTKRPENCVITFLFTFVAKQMNFCTKMKGKTCLEGVHFVGKIN